MRYIVNIKSADNASEPVQNGFSMLGSFHILKTEV